MYMQVLLLVAPLLLMMVLPRLMKSMDADSQKVTLWCGGV